MKPELFQRIKNLFNPAPEGVRPDTLASYNQAIELLEADHLQEISSLEASSQAKIAAIEQQLASSSDQLATSVAGAALLEQQVKDLTARVATLQDQLKAAPTTVDSSDPQVKVGHPEVKFGKELLAEMPSHLKDKLKK